MKAWEPSHADMCDTKKYKTDYVQILFYGILLYYLIYAFQ